MKELSIAHFLGLLNPKICKKNSKRGLPENQIKDLTDWGAAMATEINSAVLAEVGSCEH